MKVLSALSLLGLTAALLVTLNVQANDEVSTNSAPANATAEANMQTGSETHMKMPGQMVAKKKKHGKKKSGKKSSRKAAKKKKSGGDAPPPEGDQPADNKEM